MDTAVSHVEDAAIIEVNGRIDSNTAPELARVIDDVIAGAPKRLTLSLGGVGYISSSGLRVILHGAKEMKGRGGKFSLCCLQSDVLRILTLSGFDRIIPIFSDKASAAAGA